MPTGLTTTISVETPEHVALTFELAGLGSRTAAAIYDMLIVIALVLLSGAATLLIAGLVGDETAWSIGIAIALFIAFVVQWGYFALYEAFRNGRTPGKRRMGLRVVMETGHPVTVSAAAIRNLLRIVDLQPFGLGTVGMVTTAINGHNKRLGDLAAGTIVVRDAPPELVFRDAAQEMPEALEGGAPRLTDDEFLVLDRFRGRAADLPADVRSRFAAELAARFADRDALPERSNEAFVRRLHLDEQRRRAARVAVGNSARGDRVHAAAERFIARRRSAWESFRARAEQLEKSGLSTLGGADVVAFAADYREMAADMARARTYGADARVIDWLGQAVASGHNALYGGGRFRAPPVRRILFEQLPVAAWIGRYYVLAAFLLFMVPGVTGYTLLRANPQIANEILPPVMLSRADQGVEHSQTGIGYAETPSPFLPLVATSIIANNVQVAIAAFAFGMTAGAGTILMLVFNGLFFGSILGFFATRGLSEWLLTFIIGHGPLELTAIFLAGGAGLVLAHALIAPGDLARREAIVVRGRLAVRMFGLAVLMLLLAGTIEGLLSASDAPLAFKAGAGGASVVLVVLLGIAGKQKAGIEWVS